MSHCSYNLEKNCHDAVVAQRYVFDNIGKMKEPHAAQYKKNQRNFPQGKAGTNGSNMVAIAFSMCE